MSEYIDREALEKAMTIEAANGKDRDRRMWAKAICVLHDMPAADVAHVVHGRWIRKPHWCVSCSYCGKCTHDYEGEVESYNYCPNCGAKMDERDGDNA